MVRPFGRELYQVDSVVLELVGRLRSAALPVGSGGGPETSRESASLARSRARAPLINVTCNAYSIRPEDEQGPRFASLRRWVSRVLRNHARRDGLGCTGRLRPLVYCRYDDLPDRCKLQQLPVLDL